MLNDEIIVAFQPIVGLASGRVVGHEAVPRWAEKGRPPAELAARLDDLEAFGVVGSISCELIEEASADWPMLGGDLHVDVSARDLDDGDLIALASRVARGAPANAGALVLEVSERHPLRPDRVLSRRLADLRAAGVRLALDDFGTGWANMRAVQVLAPEIIKLHGHTLGLGLERDCFVIEWVEALARGVGSEVCVEGVDDERVAQRLRRLGVTLAQGSYFGDAQPAHPAERIRPELIQPS